MRSAKAYIILRMGKVFGVEANDSTFITDMIRSISHGREVSYAVDQVFTPLYIEDFIDALKRIITNGYSGIFHLASMKPLTRYELAGAICNFFDFKKRAIAPCKINSLGLLDIRPLRIDLDIAKYKATTGFNENSIEYYLNLITGNKTERL
jgi:dTDP-4-dehydrorhamnose reductase